MHADKAADKVSRNFLRYIRDMDARKDEIDRWYEMEAVRKKAEEDVGKKWQTVIADKDAAIADKDAVIADKDAAIADKDTAIADRDAAIADRDAEISRLRSIAGLD